MGITAVVVVVVDDDDDDDVGIVILVSPTVTTASFEAMGNSRNWLLVILGVPPSSMCVIMPEELTKRESR
jgi:hypothetical protein